jgi:hypothetical protein
MASSRIASLCASIAVDGAGPRGAVDVSPDERDASGWVAAAMAAADDELASAVEWADVEWVGELGAEMAGMGLDDGGRGRVSEPVARVEAVRSESGIALTAEVIDAGRHRRGPP